MKFFTNGTWHPNLPPSAEIPTPVGEPCLLCAQPIQAEDCGISTIHMDTSGDHYRVTHLACFRASIMIDGAKA